MWLTINVRPDLNFSFLELSKKTKEAGTVRIVVSDVVLADKFKLPAAIITPTNAKPMAIS